MVCTKEEWGIVKETERSRDGCEGDFVGERKIDKRYGAVDFFLSLLTDPGGGVSLLYLYRSTPRGYQNIVLCEFSG